MEISVLHKCTVENRVGVKFPRRQVGRPACDDGAAGQTWSSAASQPWPASPAPFQTVGETAERTKGPMTSADAC
jgi:hypothetical protein